ncbi:MAG: glycosyltransferase family 39 protein [Nitrospinota bacterium]|nr:glycosyltransferase family 39 protein [Nitrospinota bacterium]
MLIIVILFLIGISIRAHQLDRALGGGDENEILLNWVYIPMNQLIAPTGDPSAWHWSGGYGFDHTFHNIVLRMMTLLFGEENELAIRFPAFAAGIACLWMVYKIAKQIFPSKRVAQLAFLTMALCPIHIYYSQTARGYSFVMLFSTISIYATLKLLKSDKYFLWGLILFLSGILSVYTIQLAIIFILGLAIWILLTLTIPILKADLGRHQELISRKLYQFFSVFLLMGVGSVILYWPHMDGMLQMLDTYYDDSMADPSNWSRDIYSSYLDKLIYFIPNLLIKVFPGPLIYFTPFVFIGMFWSKTYCLAYRLLPIVILLTTYLFTLITGLAYYPRVYLFNLPLLFISLVSGIMWTGENLGNLIRSKTSINWMGYSLIGVYAALSLIEIFLNYYPSIKQYDVTEYKKSLNSKINKNDLLLVADGRHYLYARSIYKNNILNIISDNKLGKIKLLVNKELKANDYKVMANKRMPIFLHFSNKAEYAEISKDRNLFDYANLESTSILSKDFEASIDWKIQSGDGKFSSIKEHKISGDYSLLAKASSEKDMVLEGSLGDIEINEPRLIVLIWSTKRFARLDKYFMPALGISHAMAGKKYYAQIALGKTNGGMNLYVKEKTSNSSEETYYWQIHSAIGWIPPGKHSLNMFLKSEAGKPLMYDSLSLFLINK